jgi:hypothetical protein
VHTFTQDNFDRIGALTQDDNIERLTGCGYPNRNSLIVHTRTFDAGVGPVSAPRGTLNKHHTGLFAPLLFARDAIVVAVHLRAGTILQKVSRFSTGVHLRAVNPPITFELRCRSRWRLGGRYDLKRRELTLLILRITIPNGRNQQSHQDDVSHRVDVSGAP